VIQPQVFNVGDEVQTSDSGIHLIIREVAFRNNGTRYRVEATASSAASANGAWWVYHDEVRPAKNK
jgi:hypothetical protein